MKQIRTSAYQLVKITLVQLIFLLALTGMSQAHKSKLVQPVTGTVTSEKKEPLAGVSVVLKGTTLGTTTDANGKFRLDVPNPDAILVFSFIGFAKQEIHVGSTTLFNVTLTEDAASLDEVIVTGVFDKRTRMESSIAISTLNAKQIELQAPISAADILKNIPGIYVNSAAGEIKNAVYSRGFTGVNGFYYVSMQEDGLPVTGAAYSNYTPDFFLRPDLTLGKLDAVRGGTASILGNNAPGGIFNYISKTGGPEFKAEVRAKYGMEGPKLNPYYRMDANVGGPLGKDKTVFYNIGGFWRQNDGPRYTGYPLNNGGQIKGNIVKRSAKGTIMLYGKYLNDKNNFLDFLPSVNFDKPQLAPGVNLGTSYVIPPITASYYLNDSNVQQTYDSRDKIHSKEASVGLNLDYDLGKGWSVDNKVKLSDKSSYWNATQVAFPSAVDNVIFYGANGWAGRLGTYTFSDVATGTELMKVQQGVGQAGLNFTVLSGALPGGEIQKNSLIFNPLVVFDNRVKEITEQFTLNKKVKNMNFTAGAYYVHSTIKRTSTGAGTSYGQITTTYPRPTLITQTDAQGNVFKLTNSDGVIGGSNKSSAASLFDVNYNQLAGFFGYNWEITPKLNFDSGIRFENISVSGTNQIGTSVALTDGGTDKNPLTLYDNTAGKITSTYDYDKSVKTTSFSGGLNYQLSDEFAVYGRYSLGKKAPDVSIYLSVNTAANSAFLNPIAQSTSQYEMGFKYRRRNMSLFVTPFYSVLGNVPIQAIGQQTSDISSTYSTPVLYNKSDTKGIEIEGNYSFSKNWSIRAVATFQQSKTIDNYVWILGANGSADDKSVNSPGSTGNTNIFRISPNYTSGKLFGSIDWSYLGKRPANALNTFYLPAFQQTNLNLGYNVNQHLYFQANVNNVFNTYGIMDWAAPGGFPAALNTQGFTQASLEANPNAIFSTLAIQPRSYYLTVGYKF
jgi:iron complex outermembrane receptor protein